MRVTRLLMGMPITVELVDGDATADDIEAAFDEFRAIDERFSTYKTTSEISAINRGELRWEQSSPLMQEIYQLAERTKRETDGYFDIRHGQLFDPSGVVKGWAIERVAQLLQQRGRKNYYVEAGGDIAAIGCNGSGQPWRVGIRNPFNREEIVKVLAVSNLGVATSGVSERGQHIYDPHHPDRLITDIMSLTVIGPNICDADRYATAAFAMGAPGISWLNTRSRFAGYLIDRRGVATMTESFHQFVV